MTDQIIADIRFFRDSGEYNTDAAMLRTVAALNPQASRREFVAACEAEGFRGNTTANRFNESRKFDRENYGAEFDRDGRAINEY